jgi:phosphopantetheinyl transferase
MATIFLATVFLATVFSTFSRCRLAITAAFMLGMLTTVSQAYTLEQQEMCSGDAMRLCASEIPNVERITACMEERRDSLSERCRAVFETDTPAAVNETPATETPAAKPSRPVNLTPKFRHS